LLQPILVMPAGPGRYRLLAGHKRFLACGQLGWKAIPVVVQEEPGAQTKAS
jgi:ParB-like chromosome segregation protein Spo0J